MLIQQVFGTIGILLAAASGVVYIASILNGKTQPHLFTRLIFGIVETIAFFGQVVSGGGVGAWVTGASALFSVGIIILCFKYGTKNVTFSDRIFLALALVCIAVWIIVKDPFWSVLLATGIDFAAIIPTYRKTWSAPGSESLSSWILGTLKFVFSILGLSTFSFVTVIYPTEVVVVNCVLIGIILYRKDLRTHA